MSNLKCKTPGARWDQSRKLEWIHNAEREGAPQKIREWKGRVVRVENNTGNIKLIQLPDFTDAVARGAKMLDEKNPGWWRAIDVSTLDLRDQTMCVLGQSWRFYAENRDIVSTAVRGENGFKKFMRAALGVFYDEDMRTTAARFGFDIDNETGKMLNYQTGWDISYHAWDRAWESLTETWLAEIQRRQARLTTK